VLKKKMTIERKKKNGGGEKRETCLGDSNFAI